jgi:hypothetical protein
MLVDRILGQLVDVLGREYSLADVNRRLFAAVRHFDPPVVGALHVTCADESEWECADSFQHCIVDEMLPELKRAQKAPFRLSNLGARYEPGALAVAEHHYATLESQQAFKVLLIKINAHVAVEGSGAAAKFGSMHRYDHCSTACGALHALLAGGERPFLRDLEDSFDGDGVGRLTALRDPQRVAPQYRSLFVSLVSARRQTRRVEEEIQQYVPATPTLYIVASCCTLNRPEEDTELLCGLYFADHRRGQRRCAYIGLGDDPTAYRVIDADGSLRICDDRYPA